MIKKRLKNLALVFFSILCIVIILPAMPVQAGHFNSSGSGYGHFVTDGNEQVLAHSELGYYPPWNSHYFDTLTVEVGSYNDSTDTRKYTFRYYCTQYGGTGGARISAPIILKIDGVTKYTYTGYWYNPNKDPNKYLKNTTVKLIEYSVDLKAPKTYTVEVGSKDDTPYGVTVDISKQYTVSYPSYSVSFVDGLGSTLKTQSVTKYQNATPPSNPSRTGYSFAGWSGAYTSVTSNRTITATWSPNNYTVAYNANGGTGSMSTDTVTYNTSYTTKANAFSRTGYTFAGWNEKEDGSGTDWTAWIGKPWTWTYTKNITLYAQWRVNSYTNSIAHWAGGFLNGEGNNGAKNMYNFANTSFIYNYGTTYTMHSSRAASIPNGYYLASNFGTSSISGSWDSYTMPTNVSQNAGGMSYEYYYYPYNYTITYNLNGGTNNSANPSSYNVLYGVSFKNPTRSGYTFTGWYEGNTRVTGINEGKNASFSSASDMYNQLASRTTGNKTITATWDKNPTIIVKDFSVIEGDNFPESNLIAGKGYITQGDAQFPNKLVEVTYPATASDNEDGNITSRISVTKVVGPNGETLTNVNTSVTGVYTVYYQVTDNAGAIITKTRKITVLPSSTAEIKAEDRFFYRGSTVTIDILKSKILATDKYDGDITSTVTVPDINNINTNIDGDYEITYSVTNRSRKTTTKKVTVHIVETISDIETPYTLRFINKEFIETLGENSKWRLDGNLRTQLQTSLNKTSGEEAVHVYTFTNDEIKQIQNDIKTNGFSLNNNETFIESYQNRAKQK